MGGYRDEPTSASGTSVDDPKAVQNTINAQKAALQVAPKDTSATDATLAAHAARRTNLTKRGRSSTFLGSTFDGYVPVDPATPEATQNVGDPKQKLAQPPPGAQDPSSEFGTWTNTNGEWTYRPETDSRGKPLGLGLRPRTPLGKTTFGAP